MAIKTWLLLNVVKPHSETQNIALNLEVSLYIVDSDSSIYVQKY